MKHLLLASALVLLAPVGAYPAEPTIVKLWPGKAPGETKELPPEKDLTKPEDKPVGDRKIIKLTNVSTPTLAIYRPAKEKDTGTAIIICPGGAHFILAYDHEGTEVAEWLASIGVTGIVLKYRVPARDPSQRWLAAVQDAQRAVRVVRSKAKDWGINPKRIGILGFSAGGETAGRAAILFDKSHYPAVDAVDEISARPDFGVLIYPAYLVEKDNSKLRDDVKPTRNNPPMFLAHAFDDPVDVRNSLYLASALKTLGVSCELHVYATGGHGYGIRKTGHPCNTWPDRLHDWLTKMGYLKKSE